PAHEPTDRHSDRNPLRPVAHPNHEVGGPPGSHGEIASGDARITEHFTGQLVSARRHYAIDEAILREVTHGLAVELDRPPARSRRRIDNNARLPGPQTVLGDGRVTRTARRDAAGNSRACEQRQHDSRAQSRAPKTQIFHGLLSPSPTPKMCKGGEYTLQ